jgi:hypothetical protein
MAEATLSLSRAWSGNAVSGFASGQSETWNIALDGGVVGTIAYRETVEVANFRCHGPRFWPQMLAAQVKPDLWITLHRV